MKFLGVVFSCVLSLGLASSSWALGPQPPKTPLQKTEEKILLLKGVALTSQFTRISIPIPNFLRQPIDIEEGGASIHLVVSKIGFEKLSLYGADTPVERNGHPVFIATTYYGKVIVYLKIRVRYAGLNIPFDGNLSIVPASIPVNIHALETETQFEVRPLDRQNEVEIGRVSLDFNRLPKFVDEYISRMFRDQLAQAILEGIPHALINIPNDLPIPPLVN